MADIPGNKPNWHLQRRASSVTEYSSRHQGLQGGFQKFCDDPQPAETVTGIPRRHFGEKRSEEGQWVPSIKPLAEPRAVEEMTTKRYVSPPSVRERPRAERIHFVETLSPEWPDFMQTKHRVMTEGGGLAHNKSNPELPLEHEMGRHRIVGGNATLMRNGLGVSSAGDKPYITPEHSSGFYKQEGIVSKTDFRKRTEPVSHVGTVLSETRSSKPNYDEKHKADMLQQERDLVKTLDSWQPKKS